MNDHINDGTPVQLVLTFEGDQSLLECAQTSVSKGIQDMKAKETTLFDAMQLFSDEKRAEAWMIKQRWRNGINCPRCSSSEVSVRKSRKPMPLHCRKCRRYFSVRTGTVLERSKVPLRKWAIAMFMMSNHPKGVSSLQLHRDLDITQSTAWFLAHRIRKMMQTQNRDVRRAGPVEVDETYVGGKFRNRALHKRFYKGRGSVDKFPVVGLYDAATNEVTAKVVDNTTRAELQRFVLDRTNINTVVYTDEHAAYRGVLRLHQTIKHSARKYADGSVTTNRIESFWALMKRAYKGTYHYWSRKHLQRYVDEFASRHNLRRVDPIIQMSTVLRTSKGATLTYAELIA